MYAPYNRGEVSSYLGFDESFVERGVWARDHQRGQQTESESFKCVSDAGQEKQNKDQKLRNNRAGLKLNF